MKKILGLDLGTNSIGWSVIKSILTSEREKLVGIEASGSRIIPMDAGTLSDFNNGVSKSQTAERTRLRSVRKLRERSLLRRERLFRVLHLLEFLPTHFDSKIGWKNDDNKTYGKFIDQQEPKLAWRMNEEGKYEFLFKKSFFEMTDEFKNLHPELFNNGKKIPYDWTIYYLRKKALTQKIEKEELAWLLLNFNQKRGYYQQRGEEEENNQNKLVEFYELKVVDVEATDDKKGKDIWYNIHLENGWIYRRPSSTTPDWIGKTKEFIVTVDLDKDGNPKKNKNGEIKRSFRSPKEDDWTLIKKRTESDIDKSHKTVGCYIYDTLLINPSQKLNGKLVRTVERKYYKSELKTILETQVKFHPELQNEELYTKAINELYKKNEAHKRNIAKKGFDYLFLEDILFYHRPLKSKKSQIADCQFEERIFRDKETGALHKSPVKAIAKSHPLFQEFRIWKFLQSLRIYKKENIVDGKLKLDMDVTSDFIKTEEDYVGLFEWFNDKKDITQNQLLGYKPFGLNKKTMSEYRWNYVEDKTYPLNETRALLIDFLKKASIPSSVLTPETETSLWHLLYSVEDKHELSVALNTFATKHDLPESFKEVFEKIAPFKKEYGAYSVKALSKMLPLMRMGKYWKLENISPETIRRIDCMIDGEYDEKIKDRVYEKVSGFQNISQFKGLPEWLVSYIIYNRHAEAKDIDKWETPEDIDLFLKKFKQHSLRNPIVEQVITETLRTVRDIWKKVGSIDEIHIELGREMKNPADKRKKMTEQISENENTNIRIKKLLLEFANPDYEIENVRPFSPSQQEILRIYEDGALNSVEQIPDDVNDIIKKFKESDNKKQPTKSEINKYKIWLEQNYRSPYTGEIIPLAKLFTPAYEIEHIIPQSRFFDDSLSNKVVCEAEVNKLKDNQLGYEFIQAHQGEIVTLTFGKKVKIFTIEAYEAFVKKNYRNSKAKMNKLLLENIPDSFIERQLNDSRYISKVIKGLLSNIVREKDSNGEYEPEAISKNVITCSGGITDRLKKEWGMNDIWNDIVSPRFIRLNEKTNSTAFGEWINKNGKNIFLTQVPIEYQKGFNKKRIDHRHHAMDAIVIACATRDHVNYLNNESAKSENNKNRYLLARKLRQFNKVSVIRNGETKTIDVAGDFIKPWDTFTQDARNSLEKIIVSFKQNTRVINRTTNHYLKFDEHGKKVSFKQESGDSWAIRKPLHKDTVFGNVNLRKIKTVNLNAAVLTPNAIVNKELKIKIRELLRLNYDGKNIARYFKDNKEIWRDINLSKIEVYYFTNDTKDPLVATRKNLDESFTQKKIEESVTDSGIQKILLKHLDSYEDNPSLAFSADGIDQMNKNIVSLNDNKPHQPIYKVRVYEPLGFKYKVGKSGNKQTKFVEAAKGTNLFFAVYESENGDRSYDTIPLNIVIDREKELLTPVPDANANGDRLLFYLSPNDLVYMPTPEERELGVDWNNIDIKRVYKFVSASGNQAFFIPNTVASPIINTIELGANNKAEKSWEDQMIKKLCIPLKLNRIGEIIK